MRLAAWAVHAYTASGAVMALLALVAGLDGDYRTALLWLAAQVFVDSTDGTLARLARVKEVTPQFDGTRLDDLVDYLAYVFVPAVLILRAGLLPAAWAVPVVALVLLSSGYGFARDDAKTADHFFTGFPSYWNVVAVYLFAFRAAPWVNAVVLLALVALVFVRVRYVYPSRTAVLRGLTIALGSVWAVQMLLLIRWIDAPPAGLAWSALAYPAYYFGLSFWLEWRRRASPGAAR